MASRKTWIWIIVGVLGLCVLALLAIAGAGVYFVSSHVGTERASASDAQRAFDQVREQFKSPPLFTLDENDHVQTERPVDQLPAGSVHPGTLWVLAWDSNDERLVRVSLPFWLLRLGQHKVNVSGGHGFELERLHLNIDQLERIGPALLLDHRPADRDHVVIWTQ